MQFFSKHQPAAIQQMTLISGTCALEGKLELSGELQISGTFKGDIVSSSTVIIAAGAKVQGEIRAAKLFIKGEFSGECTVPAIHILQAAVVTGTLYTNELSIEPGASFIGQSCPYQFEDPPLLPENALTD